MYINRSNQAVIFQSFERSFVTALLGPRRVGKSTLVLEFSRRHPDRTWIFLNMDKREERLAIEINGLKSLIQESAREQLGKNKLWIAIDEAQKCPRLFNQIKALYDQYKDQNRIKFILTGSGFLSLHQLSAETLAGRIELYHLREFGLHETILLQQSIDVPSDSLFDMIGNHYHEQIENHIETLAPFRPILEEGIQEEICWGGLPEVLQLSNPTDRLRYLSNYLQTYLEKDIRAIETISDLNLYQKLMEITAEQTGSTRQDQYIIEAIGCSRDTLKKYRGFLLATLVYKEIYPFIGSSLKRLVKSPKGYLTNNGLISYLTGIDDISTLQTSGLIGHRFENWFLKELHIWLDRDPKRSQIYYWRTSGGVEVDFVVEKKPSVFPFEVTYSQHQQSKKIKNLQHFLKEEPKAKMGFYIYMGPYHYDPETRICFLPAWCVG